MQKETIFALAVSLLTWGGVWLYMLRLDALSRSLERRARDLDARADSAERDPLHDPLRNEVPL